jgi:Zn-dependent membrane protease YugP
MVGFASKITSFTLMIGVLLAIFSQNYWLLTVGVIALGVTTLFTFITLPVEFDASKRALAWLDRANVTHNSMEHDGAKDALKWAATTYVIAALSALVTLLYYASMLMGRRD